MKTPKTKFVVISAIGLASIVGIFVSAQSPTPSTVKELPFHLVMQCASVEKAKVQAAASPLPSDTYRFEFGPNDVIGTLPHDSSLAPCPAHFIPNSTQTAKFANTKELRAFLDAAGL